MIHSKNSGQVLILGIVILVALLLLILVSFDVHNIIRAKLKVETAHEAAAIAGAKWQQESLNLIGEINLIKACAALLERDDNWQVSLPKLNPLQPDSYEQRRAAIQARIDVLTEMQSRVSFIGPIIGFAAAQQAAKANGLPANGNLKPYIELLQNNSRYCEETGGAKKIINNYLWRAPYIELIQEISNSGIAVYPNARINTSVATNPYELGREKLYLDIHRHASEIATAKGKPLINQSSWLDSTLNFVYQDPWKNRFAHEPWWDIDYSLGKFPNESEIFTLGVETSFSQASDIHSYDGYNSGAGIYDNRIWKEIIKLASKTTPERADTIYRNSAELPAQINMKWFCYDNTWYPEYYRQHHSDYDSNHYEYWFSGSALRRPVKKMYRYEGAAAYVEGMIDVGRVSKFRVSGQKSSSSPSNRIGAKSANTHAADIEDSRPGAIAKPLGELSDARPPIHIPIILPVFKSSVIHPTYMPIPYGFGVLRMEHSLLDKFLSWLAVQKTINGNLAPAETNFYQEALQNLMKDRDFRYYGWNPGHNSDSFDQQWRDKLLAWHEGRNKFPEKYLYTPAQGMHLPGWLQEPQIFFDNYKSKKSTASEVVTDYINGGKALRVFTDNGGYMVVNSAGHIITNREIDPTVNYNTLNDDSGGFGGTGYHGQRHSPDFQKGPPRL